LVAACRVLRPLSVEAVQVAAALASSEDARHRYIRERLHFRPLLNGRNLTRLGVPPGPQVDALLEALSDARLEGPVRTRRDEEAFVQEQLGTPTP